MTDSIRGVDIYGAGTDDDSRLGRTAAALLTVVVALLAAAVAAQTTLAWLADGSKLAIVLPIAALVGLGLVALALVDFEAFVLVSLAVRSSLDALKYGGSGAEVANPGVLLGMLFFASGVLWLVINRQAAGDWRLSRLAWSWLAFLGAAALGIVVSVSPVSSALEWSRIAGAAVMFLVVERLAASYRTRERLLVAVYVSAVVPFVVAIWQWMTGSDLFTAGGFSRVQGTFTHSNPMAAFVAFLVIMAGALLIHEHRSRVRAAALIFLAVAVPVLVVTYTRGAWLAAVIGLLVVAFQRSHRVALTLAACLVVLAVAIPGVSARFADLATTENASGTSGNSLVWRLEYWQETFALSEESPVTGVGLKQVAASTEEGKQPHNDVLRAYVELGLIGLVTYVWFLIQLVATGRRSVRATSPRGSPLDQALASGFLGVSAAFVTLSVVANLMSQVVVLWYVAAFAGIASALTTTAISGQSAQAGSTEPVVTTEQT